MKKVLLSLAALAAMVVTAQSAAAQGPAPAGQPGCQQCDAGTPGYPGYDPYGGHGGKSHGFGFGLLHGLFHNHGGGRQITTLPVASGGQLAYPMNPFTRGPRDYFMWDEK